MKKLILPVSLLLIAAWIGSKIKLAKNIDFKIQDVQFIPSFPTSKISLVIRLINPTNGTTTITNLTGDLLSNGVKLGYVNLLNNYTIPKNGFVDVDVDVVVSNFTTLNTIINVIKTKKINIDFVGTLTSDNFLLPINYTYTI